MNDVVGKGGVMTTRSQHGANHNRKHCLKRDGLNKSTRFVVLGRPVAQSSTLDTDGFDHILFQKHQTALKKTLNAALKRHSTTQRHSATQRQHGLRLSWIVYAFSSVEAGAVPLKLLTDACPCRCVLTCHGQILLWAPRRVLLHTHQMSSV